MWLSSAWHVAFRATPQVPPNIGISYRTGKVGNLHAPDSRLYDPDLSDYEVTQSDAYSADTDRWNNAAFYHANSTNRQNVLPTKGGHLIKDDPYAFDAAFFNISGAEAAAMDPKQRISLEVAYEAFENAGMAQQKVAGSRTACYIGSTMSDYRDAVIRDFEHYPTVKPRASRNNIQARYRRQ